MANVKGKITKLIIFVILTEILLFTIFIVFGHFYSDGSQSLLSSIFLILFFVAITLPIIYFYRQRKKINDNFSCEKCGLKIPDPVTDEEALEVTNVTIPQALGCPILYYCPSCKIYWHVDDNVEYIK